MSFQPTGRSLAASRRAVSYSAVFVCCIACVNCSAGKYVRSLLLAVCRPPSDTGRPPPPALCPPPPRQNLRQQKSRRDQFSQGGVSSNLPPSATQGFHQGSVLLADEAASASGGDVALDMDGVRERRPAGGAASQQQQQMMLIEQEVRS